MSSWKIHLSLQSCLLSEAFLDCPRLATPAHGPTLPPSYCRGPAGLPTDSIPAAVGVSSCCLHALGGGKLPSSQELPMVEPFPRKFRATICLWLSRRTGLSHSAPPQGFGSFKSISTGIFLFPPDHFPCPFSRTPACPAPVLCLVSPALAGGKKEWGVASSGGSPVGQPPAPHPGGPPVSQEGPPRDIYMLCSSTGNSLASFFS